MRASSLSNPAIIDLLNTSFVPVLVDGVYLNQNEASDADEKAAYRSVFQKFFQANKELSKIGLPTFSTGSVHAYVLSADGSAVDSLHVADAARPEQLLKMLEKAKERLKVTAGKPLGKIAPQSAPPKAEADALILHLTARYLTPKGHANARKDVDDDLVPLKAAGLGKQGGWHSLPSEDWIVLPRAEWSKLLPAEKAALGKSWDIDPKVAAKILVRFYPTTELNDLAKNRIDQQSLKATIIALEAGTASARLEGSLKMKHAFYPNRDDNNFVDAAFVGIMEFDVADKKLKSLRLVTEKASYGGNVNGTHPFGVAVRSLP
jgi:hypothetical protein